MLMSKILQKVSVSLSLYPNAIVNFHLGSALTLTLPNNTNSECLMPLLFQQQTLPQNQPTLHAFLKYKIRHFPKKNLDKKFRAV